MRTISGLVQILTISVLLAVVVAGCGGSVSPFDSVPVSGKVTYDDGSPIPVGGMQLTFHSMVPPQDGMHPRPGVVGVKGDGTFENVTSYKYADGLVLGKHKVVIIVKEAGGALSSKIPKTCAYAKSTPVEVEVTDSGQFLEIKVPKP